VLDSFDFAASSVLLPLGCLLLAVFVGWRWGRREAMAATGLGGRLAIQWHRSVRYLAPVVIIIVLIAGLLSL
jgi:NSS family neurotransmitter:Na+ symporter